MRSSRGFFFSLDVLLFLFIIAFGFTLVFGALPGKVPRTQSILLADSMATFLASTQVEDIQSLISDTATSPELSIFEQAALYIVKGTSPNAFLEEIITRGSTSILPGKYGLEIYIYRYGSPEGAARYFHPSSQGIAQNAELLISSKRVIYFYSKSEGKVIGPYIGEVRLW